MSEPDEYYIDGPSYIESSELEEVMDEVNDRLEKLESKLAASDGQTIESSEGEPLHAGLATLTANEVINRLKITPIDLVDILNGVDIYDDYGNIVNRQRLITTDEGHFRAHTFSEPYFTEEMLKKVKIYQLKFDQYCDEWEIQPSSNPAIRASFSSRDFRSSSRSVRNCLFHRRTPSTSSSCFWASAS